MLYLFGGVMCICIPGAYAWDRLFFPSWICFCAFGISFGMAQFTWWVCFGWEREI
jgi:hypothetical protein